MDDQPIIGREREQAQLQAWAADALAGRGSLVLLAGEAGVGKTTLARAQEHFFEDDKLAGRFAERLAAADGVEVLNQVVLNQVLVRFEAADGDHDAHTRRVVERVQQDGTCWMSGTTWQGKAAMRISVSNWSTDEADVDRSVAAILAAAGAV